MEITDKPQFKILLDSSTGHDVQEHKASYTFFQAQGQSMPCQVMWKINSFHIPPNRRLVETTTVNMEVVRNLTWTNSDALVSNGYFLLLQEVVTGRLSANNILLSSFDHRPSI